MSKKVFKEFLAHLLNKRKILRKLEIEDIFIKTN